MNFIFIAHRPGDGLFNDARLATGLSVGLKGELVGSRMGPAGIPYYPVQSLVAGAFQGPHFFSFGIPDFDLHRSGKGFTEVVIDLEAVGLIAGIDMAVAQHPMVAPSSLL